jgi:ankyrin repeat protein
MAPSWEFTRKIKTTGIHYAVYYALSQILEVLLLSHGESVVTAINATDNCYGKPIELAARQRNTKIAKTLLDSGATVTTRAITWAARMQNIQMLKLFLNSYSNIEAEVMPYVACCGVDYMELILEVACKTNRQAELSSIGLPWAVYARDADMCRLLLQMGADPNARIPEPGDSALAMAAYYSEASIVALLLDSGADPGTLDPDFEVTDLDNKQLADQIVTFVRSTRQNSPKLI